MSDEVFTLGQLGSIPLQRFLRIRPQDVNESVRQHLVTAQRPVVRVIGMSGDQRILQRGPTAHGHDDGRVAPNALPELELDEIPRLQFGQVKDLHPYRTWPGRRQSGQKVIKIRHSRPRGGFLVGVDVVPAKGGRVVHHAYPRVEALGGEIGAVAAQVFIVVVGRIPTIGPPVGVGHRSGPVIRDGWRWI